METRSIHGFGKFIYMMTLMTILISVLLSTYLGLIIFCVMGKDQPNKKVHTDERK